MIDAFIFVMAVTGILAIFLDYFDWQDMRDADGEEHDPPATPADDGPVIVTDIGQLIGRFDPNGR